MLVIMDVSGGVLRGREVEVEVAKGGESMRLEGRVRIRECKGLTLLERRRPKAR